MLDRCGQTGAAKVLPFKCVLRFKKSGKADATTKHANCICLRVIYVSLSKTFNFAMSIVLRKPYTNKDMAAFTFRVLFS